MTSNEIDLVVRGPPAHEHDLTARLAKIDVDRNSCIAAMRGERVPSALGSPLMQFCLIRGIRHHSGFGDEVRSATPALMRAWNARRIMSDAIPDIADSDHVPYCIWHPQVASESTYRTLVQRYPQMRYQVARACAVAGYVDLYRELDVLPEVHVAEEARDNGHLAIFDDITAAPVRYAVMNDYDRTITLDSPRPGAVLNDDTAVRSSLERKCKIQMSQPTNFWDEIGDGRTNSMDSSEYEGGAYVHENFKPGYFNITEDGNIDTYDGYPEAEAEATTAPESVPDLISPLLYSPLPQDLPTGNKDVLIFMAAYYGDIDRYARLRRPARLEGLVDCVIHGIYHNTLFAKWWADRIAAAEAAADPTRRLDIDLDHLPCKGNMETVRKAITARFIMNNDLSRVTKDTKTYDLPYCIWYPGCPSRETIKELVRRRPDMKHQAARACMVAGCFELFKEIDPEPHEALFAEARCSRIPDYTEFLEDKIVKAGSGFKVEAGGWDSWKMITRDSIREPWGTEYIVYRKIDRKSIGAPLWWEGALEGSSVDTSRLDMSVCARDVMLKEGQDELNLNEFYAEGEGEGEGEGQDEGQGEGEKKSEVEGEGEGTGEGEGVSEAAESTSTSAVPSTCILGGV